MNRQQLIDNIRRKRSFLCIGLDTDLSKIPEHLLDEEDPVFAFNKAIIEATSDLAVAYKPNLAFYECLGPGGWQSLAKTMRVIPDDVFTIADAKRGDIGNTSRYYAQTFFEQYNFDSVTVAPYMGSDSVKPFLEFENKWVILLALTSNKGADDFQFFQNGAGKLFENVIMTSQKWGSPDNMMYVCGATRPEMLEDVRKLAPDHFLLVPGVGAQGGNLRSVAQHGMNKDVGLLINSSRGILYASSGTDFAEAARHEALKLQEEMGELLDELQGA